MGRFSAFHDQRLITEAWTYPNSWSIANKTILRPTLIYFTNYMLTTSGPGDITTPLEQPEKALQQAMQQIESATTEQWEKIVNSMYTVQRVSNCHPNVLASKFSPLIRLLSKQVRSIRLFELILKVICYLSVCKHS